jgi:hypothetical protein
MRNLKYIFIVVLVWLHTDILTAGPVSGNPPPVDPPGKAGDTNCYCWKYQRKAEREYMKWLKSEKENNNLKNQRVKTIRFKDKKKVANRRRSGNSWFFKKDPISNCYNW